MKKILKYIILLVLGFGVVTVWSFTRSGYIENIYFRPTVISTLFFIIGLIVKSKKIKLLEVILLLLPSLYIILSTYNSHQIMFWHDLPLLPFWATLSFYLGYLVHSLKKTYIVIVFIVFVSISNIIYANSIGRWDELIDNLTSPKLNTNIYNGTPPHALLNKDSIKTNIGNLQGKIILFEFYRNSCLPCIEQLPLLTKVQDKFKKENFEVILLNTGRIDTYKQAFTNKYFANKGIKILYDVDGKLTSHLNIQGVPQQFLVDKNGKIIRHVVGSSNATSENYKFQQYENLISRELKD